jgi:hypothetical protein
VKKHLPALLAVIGFCVTVGILVSRSHARIQIYEGKTVKAWLLQLCASDPRARAEAEAAFEALGTNAVPELTRLARARDAGWRKVIWIHAARLPQRMRAQVLTRVGPTNACVFRPLAAQALGKLGPAAAPAVPTLIRMLRRGGSPYEQTVAAQSLANIGAPALTALIDLVVHEEGAAGNAAASALLRHYPWPGSGGPAGETLPGDQTASARQHAIEKLGASGKTNEAVVKVLARAARDPAPCVRLAALKALAQANRNLQPALPQLVACSHDESPAIREGSARALGKINFPARPAIHALTRLARDEHASVRLAAQEALETINAGGTVNRPTPPK